MYTTQGGEGCGQWARELNRKLSCLWSMWACACSCACENVMLPWSLVSLRKFSKIFLSSSCPFSPIAFLKTGKFQRRWACTTQPFPLFTPLGFPGHTENASCFFHRWHKISAGGTVPAVGAVLSCAAQPWQSGESCLLRGLGSKPIWLLHWTKSFNSAFLSDNDNHKGLHLSCWALFHSIFLLISHLVQSQNGR